MFKIFTSPIKKYQDRKASKAAAAERLKQAAIENEKTIRLMQLIVGLLLIGIISYGLQVHGENVKDFMIANTILVAFPLVLYAITIIWLDTVMGLLKTLVFVMFYFTLGIFFLPFIFLGLLVVELVLKEIIFNLIDLFLEALFD